MVVVEDQQHLAVTGLGGQLVDQRRHQPLERRRRRRAQQRGRPARRSPAAPGPARRPHAARTAPGRCRRRPATARPPAAGRAGPSRPAGPSCRTRPGRRPGRARAPAPRRAPRTSRGRGTKPGCGRGTCSLVASSTSRSDAATPDGVAAGGSAIGDLHAQRSPAMLRVAAGSAHSNNWLAGCRAAGAAVCAAAGGRLCALPFLCAAGHDQVRVWAAVGRPEVQMTRLQKPTHAPWAGGVRGSGRWR